MGLSRTEALQKARKVFGPVSIERGRAAGPTRIERGRQVGAGAALWILTRARPGGPPVALGVGGSLEAMLADALERYRQGAARAAEAKAAGEAATGAVGTEASPATFCAACNKPVTTVCPHLDVSSLRSSLRALDAARQPGAAEQAFAEAERRAQVGEALLAKVALLLLAAAACVGLVVTLSHHQWLGNLAVVIGFTALSTGIVRVVQFRRARRQARRELRMGLDAAESAPVVH